jgi:drug/metabolite transporter (DMT)-like permease
MYMRGMELAIISAILFGTVTGSSKLLLGSAGPATVGALTYLGAGLVGLLAAALSPVPVSGKTGNCVSFSFIAALILGAIAAPLLLMTGLQWTTASLASVLTNIEGIATAGLAWLFFREKSDAISIVCIIAILAGVACFTFSEDVVATGSIGPLLVGAAYVCWALDINLMRRVANNITAPRATAIRGIAGAFVMVVVAWLCGETLPDSATLIGGLLTGAVGFGISFILILNALPSIGAAKAGAIFASAPIFSYVCSSLVEGGTFEPSGMQLIAITLIAFGILLTGTNTFLRERTGPRATLYAAQARP